MAEVRVDRVAAYLAADGASERIEQTRALRLRRLRRRRVRHVAAILLLQILVQVL